LFEVLAEDLLGRIGRIRTRDGKSAETPLFLPVINPVTQDIPANWMRESLGAEAVITNAYIILRRLREQALSRGVHGILNFDGIVMTDSGGYQVLEYGGVETSPEEIAIFQEEVGSDIAVPLDIPTGLSGRERAEETVEMTLRNLRITLSVLEGRGSRRALWAAPIQGGIHLDLLRRCAEEERIMDFDLYALGSPTPLMEGYQFSKLFKMISTVRPVIGFGKPLHLFGAGHPMIFPFIVALGVDMFDSASYYIYARDGRYITETGTMKIDKLDYLPCCCPICSKLTARELREAEGAERVRLLAMHNLHVCYMEVRRIKQAIRDGRLMELLEMRARSHPSLYQGFIEVMRDEDLLRLMERHTPISTRRGINLYDWISMRRPEVASARRRLRRNCFSGGRGFAGALLLPESMEFSPEKASRIPGDLDILFYGGPFGLIPLSLRYCYPFSQVSYPRALIEDNLDELVSEAVGLFHEAGYRRAYVVKARSRHLERFRRRLVEDLRKIGIEVQEVEDVRDLLSAPGGNSSR